MNILPIVDFILAIPYILFFLIIAKYIASFYNYNEEDKKILLRAIIYRVGLLIFYLCLIAYFYGFGDNLSYFEESIFARNAVADGSIKFWDYLFNYNYIDFYKQGWIRAGSNSGVIVEKISFLLSYISFKSYLITSILFCFLFFSGVWKMFQTFNKLHPTQRNTNSIIVLFLPTITLYGSPILKDSIGICALGFIVHFLYKLFIEKKRQVLNIILLFFFSYLLFSVRSFVVLTLLMPLAIFKFVIIIINLKKNVLKQLLSLIIYFAFVVATFIIFKNQIQDKVIDDLIGELKNNKMNYDIIGGGSNFNNNVTEDFTINDLIINFPQGIFNVIFRPSIFEANSLLMILSALENLFITILVVRTILRNKFSNVILHFSKNQFDLYLFLFSILFCGFVSFYSSNFGTISRYRISGIPLFLYSLLSINAYKNYKIKNG